jgi:hypothetical protein
MRSAALVLVALAMAGCRRSDSSASAPPAPGENLTGQQRVVGAMPILRRNITANDMHQLKVFIEQAHIETNRYPASLADMPGLQRDAPNLAKLISEGDLVLSGGTNGVLAYSKAGLERRSAVLLTSGVQEMEPDELRKLVQ